MDGWVTPPKRVASPTWGPPPPCKQTLSVHFCIKMSVKSELTVEYFYYLNMMRPK